MAANESSEPTKSRVSFSIAKNENSAAADQSLTVKEEESFDSVVSDDGESDIDDVPEALLLDEIVGSQHGLQAISQKIDLAAFFQSTRYRTISLIFGPMVCFFCVAMRVEIFNIFAGIFVDQTQVWYKLLTQFFWVELSLYCIMIVEMLMAIVVFLYKRDGERRLFACSAAVFGLLINIMCLLLLVIAETKRCCSDNGYDNENDKDIFARLLGPASSTEGYSDPSTSYVECCPHFGSRKYGGLGDIEPFTCLIALSPLRFFVADNFVKLFGYGPSHDEDMHMGKEEHGNHGSDPTAKVRDLWLTAIGVHGDIAKSCGLFSSELLQCMLGIYCNESGNNNGPEASVEDNESSADIKSPSSGQEGSQSHHREHSLDFRSDTSSRGLASSPRPPTHKRYESDSFGVTFDDFAYPMARLLRRMRRCERRVSPILDEWLVVDVVMTSHELVIFDVLDETEGVGTTHKNGGKGMQLCDVAKGRKILSQFALDDVDFVDIEHRAASRMSINAEDVEMSHRNNLLEYWQGGHSSSDDYEMDEMNNRWENADEDRLKVHFKYNTLFLRFMADLSEMEHKSTPDLDDPILMNHIGSQTKIWCRTIARLRGASNLKQNLPHFGNDGTDEIEDFIELCERDHHQGNRNAGVIRKRRHRRMSSDHPSYHHSTGAAHEKIHRRVSSFMA